MKTQLQVAALSALAVVANLAGLIPAVPEAIAPGDDEVLGLCKAYASLCSAGTECCSEVCDNNWTDGQFRCS